MKKYFLSVLGILTCLIVFGQNNVSKKDSTKPVQIVEAACGQCQFKLPGKSCDLAIRISGKAYFVEGTSIDEHGDAHANDGFCNAIRKAEIQGVLVDDKFKISYFKLAKEKKN